MKRIIILTVTLAICQSSIAQKPVGLQLTVKVKGSNKPLAAAWVDIEQEDSFITTAYSSDKGVFTYLFAYNGLYRATFNAHGFLPKTLEIDTRFVPPFDKSHLHDWAIGEIALIKAFNQVKTMNVQEPVGRIHYDTTDMDFAIDYKYTMVQQQEVKVLSNKVEILEQEQVAQEKSQKQIYDSLLALGDKYNQRGLRQEALDLYTLAGLYLPGRVEHLERKQDLLVVLRRDSMYQENLTAARHYIEKGDYRSAHDKLLMADGLKPRQNEVKALLARTSVGIQANQEKQNRFNNLLYLGEAAMTGGSFKEAVRYYTAALEVEPDAALAKRKLGEAQLQLAVQEKELADRKLMQARQDSAMKFLQQAKLLRFKNIDAAYEYAQKSLSVPVNDSLIKADANAIVEQWHRKEQARHSKAKFEKLLAVSLDNMNANKHDEALLAINEALLLMPGNTEAIEQKRDVETALKKDGLDRNFKFICEKGRSAFESGDLVEARRLYSSALALKPREAMPKKQIQTIDMQLATLDKHAKEEKAHAGHEKNIELENLDKGSEAFKQALAAHYPDGITEETIQGQRKTIIRRIVVVGNTGSEYLRVKHDWGGIYYFKNGATIPDYIWEKETVKP